MNRNSRNNTMIGLLAGHAWSGALLASRTLQVWNRGRIVAIVDVCVARKPVPGRPQVAAKKARNGLLRTNAFCLDVVPAILTTDSEGNIVYNY
jgi:hypothetical protein